MRFIARGVKLACESTFVSCLSAAVSRWRGSGMARSSIRRMNGVLAVNLRSNNCAAGTDAVLSLALPAAEMMQSHRRDVSLLAHPWTVRGGLVSAGYCAGAPVGKWQMELQVRIKFGLGAALRRPPERSPRPCGRGEPKCGVLVRGLGKRRRLAAKQASESQFPGPRIPPGLVPVPNPDVGRPSGPQARRPARGIP